MKFSAPSGWILGCLCVSPAAVALCGIKSLYVLEAKGKVTGGPEMGVAPLAGFVTLVICIGGSLFPAIWLNKKREHGATFYYWVGLIILNVIITVPGCAMIGH
ncbi:MAG TPA: hypothetical protein VK961_15625 [Chthoniobacter sp.]|nr:hypothetical protein [Chthoniobacter sp.]